MKYIDKQEVGSKDRDNTQCGKSQIKANMRDLRRSQLRPSALYLKLFYRSLSPMIYLIFLILPTMFPVDSSRKCYMVNRTNPSKNESTLATYPASCLIIFYTLSQLTDTHPIKQTINPHFTSTDIKTLRSQVTCPKLTCRISICARSSCSQPIFIPFCYILIKELPIHYLTSLHIALRPLSLLCYQVFILYTKLLRVSISEFQQSGQPICVQQPLILSFTSYNWVLDNRHLYQLPVITQ